MDQLAQKVGKETKIMLVFGSEGYGVSPHLSRNSDFSVTIGRTGNDFYPYDLVDSLNVNAAVCCILSHICKT